LWGFAIVCLFLFFGRNATLPKDKQIDWKSGKTVTITKGNIKQKGEVAALIKYLKACPQNTPEYAQFLEEIGAAPPQVVIEGAPVVAYQDAAAGMVIVFSIPLM
jgi:hypothetical protein